MLTREGGGRGGGIKKGRTYMVEGIRKDEGRGEGGREEGEIIWMEVMRKKIEGRRRVARQMKPRRKWKRKIRVNYNKRT
jgi:hypothetical protein